MKTVVLSQFKGPSPYALQQASMLWIEFLRRVMNHEYDDPMRMPVLDDTPSNRTFKCPWGCSAYRESSDGTVELFQSNWDSSG